MITSYVIPSAVVDPQSHQYFVECAGFSKEPYVEIIYVPEPSISRMPRRCNMSEETKKTVQEISEQFKKLKTFSDDAIKKIGAGDKELVRKISTVKEGADTVIKHIEQRTEPKAQ